MSTTRAHSPDLRHGALLMVASAVLFASMAAAVRVAARELPNAPIVFFRHFLMLLFLLPWLRREGAGALATRDRRGHLVARPGRGVRRGLLLLRHRPPAARGCGAAQPVDTGVFQPAALVAVASAGLASIAQVGIRRLTHTEPVMRIVFYFGLIASLAAAPFALATWRTPSLPTWGTLLLMGVFATAGQLTLTRAYVHAPAALVGPFLYAGPVFAGLLDWVIWGRLPDAPFVAGAILVVLAATLALRLRAAPAPALPGG